MKNSVKFTAVLLAALALAACGKKNTVDNSSITDENTPAPTTVQVNVEPTPAPSVSVISSNNTEVTLGLVHFALDQYSLSAAAKKTLEANASSIKNQAAGKDYTVTVEGYCDERGTIAYNIALGEKRATEVKNYYNKLGVSAAKMTTISYGKEDPLCTDENETCWAQNRRANTVLQVK